MSAMTLNHSKTVNPSRCAKLDGDLGIFLAEWLWIRGKILTFTKLAGPARAANALTAKKAI